MHLTLWLMCCEFILGNFLRNHFYLQNHRGCKIPHPNDFESEELLKLKLRFFFSIAFDFKTLWVIIFSSITVMILQSKRKCKRWKLEEKLLTVTILLHMFLKTFNELLFSPPQHMHVWHTSNAVRIEVVHSGNNGLDCFPINSL